MILIPTLFCPKSWESMTGKDTQRFCSYCKKNVHNLETLSARDRLALLASPAASVCSRYRLAIRQPAKGREDAYRRHLLRYDAGVALTGSVLLVLWEWHGREEKQKYYRAAGISPSEQGMPRKFYTEHQVIAVGGLYLGPLADPEMPSILLDVRQSATPELRIDLEAVNRLIGEARPKLPAEIPRVELKPD